MFVCVEGHRRGHSVKAGIRCSPIDLLMPYAGEGEEREEERREEKEGKKRKEKEKEKRKRDVKKERNKQSVPLT